MVSSDNIDNVEPAGLFYGFQFPHHGAYTGFAALGREFPSLGVRVCRVGFPHSPNWWPGRVRIGVQHGWFRLQEQRLRAPLRAGVPVHYFFPENSLFSAAKWKRKGPLILSCHQPAAQLRTSPYLANRGGFFEGLRAADVIILMASNDLEAYRALAPSARVICIPHGVATNHFTPAPEPRSEDSRPVFKILTTGNWMRDYDLWTRVAQRLTRDYDLIEFTVVAQEAVLAGLAQALGDRDGRVRLLCAITDEQLLSEYRRADVAFLPLLDTWANNALLESMACGKPAVVTDLPAAREYAGEAALYVPHGDEEAACATLLSLRDNREKCNMYAHRARERMVTGFAWRDIARYHVDLYREMGVVCREREIA